MNYCVIRRRSSDELMHYGIKGQKWGVRRFQNEDGTRTKAGLERYSNDSSDDYGELHSLHRTRKNKYLADDGTMTEEGKSKYEKALRTSRGQKISATKMFTNAAYMDRSARNLTKTLEFIPGMDGLIGAGIGAIGSVAVDAIHNFNIARAKRFVDKYQEAYIHTTTEAG